MKPCSKRAISTIKRLYIFAKKLMLKEGLEISTEIFKVKRTENSSLNYVEMSELYIKMMKFFFTDDDD